MVVYPDTSAIIAYFQSEAHSPKAIAILEDRDTQLHLSDFAVTEASAVFAARARGRKAFTASFANQLRLLDMLAASLVVPLRTAPADVASATTFVRRLDLTLRVPDALHLAICTRVGAALLTVDAQQAAAATRLGIPLAA